MVRVFGHFVPRGLLVLVALEFVLLVSSYMLGVHLRFAFWSDPDGELASIRPLQGKAIVFAWVMMSAMMSMGLYSRHLRDTAIQMVMRILASLAMGLVVMVLLYYLMPAVLGIGRAPLMMVMGVTSVLLVALRLLFMHAVSLDVLKKRILVLGSGRKATAIDRVMRRESDRRGISVVGYVHFSKEQPLVSGRIIEHSESLLELARRYRVQEIVVAVDNQRENFPIKEIVECRLIGVGVLDILSFIERQAGKIMLENLTSSWLIFSDGFQYSAVRVVGKRVFDVTSSLALLALAWPVMLGAVVAIKLYGGRGPVLYRQVRVGAHGETFNVLKFRSMTVDAEKHGAQWAKQNDARVTAVGGFMRKYRIDELPQLFNVLVGTMSFVGPRPERPEFVKDLSAKIIYYSERHRVKPGITGWAQICYPYGASERDAAEKLSYDLYYVKNYSLFLDLVILLQTAQAVLWKRGGR